MNLLLVLPILIPFFAAAAGLVAWQRLQLQRALGLAGSAGLLAVAILLVLAVGRNGIQVTHIGSWPAPFGITLVADRLGAIMVLLGGIAGFAVAVYSCANIDQENQSFAYFPLLNILLMGVSAAFLTGDIFNLYVWFEVLLISSFVLLALGAKRPQLEGAIKYMMLNVLASFLFLIGCGILYGAVGTLNMADAAQKLRALDNPHLVTTISMVFLIAFGIKAAVFPLFFWLPASYHTPPAAVSAIFAGMLTKVGVYALIRVFTLMFVQDEVMLNRLFLVVASLTMITGVLGAVAQNEFRRILSFHIISQIGYMILGLGIHTPLGIAGSVFYIAHHIIVKTNLFLVSGIAHSLRGTYDLARLGGLYRDCGWLAILFAVPALSLAGIPPLSGFVAKLILIRAGFEAGNYVATAVAIAVSLLTLYSMAKIWNAAFWKPDPPGEKRVELFGGEDVPGVTRSELAQLVVPSALLACLTVAIGLGAGPLLDWSQEAAHELLDREAYIEAVLGDAP